MKPSDLRLGNYVNFKNREDIDYCEVTDLSASGGIYILRNFKYGEGDDQLEAIEDITGIPLTEAWLERLGLIKKYLENPFQDGGYELDEKGNRWYSWVDDGAFNLEVQSDGQIWFEIYSNYAHLKYVHQLQNLYYAVREKELVIK